MNRENRIAILQERMREHGLDSVLLFYSRDILYYTGTAQPSYLVILPEDYFLFARSGIEFALEDVFIKKDKVRAERRLGNIFKEVFSGRESGGKKIGAELVKEVAKMGGDFTSFVPPLTYERVLAKVRG